MLDHNAINKLMNLLAQSEKNLKTYQTVYPYYNNEAYITIFRIKSILLTKKDNVVQALVNLLIERWQHIQDTDSQYLHDLVSPANSLCIVLAKELSSLLAKNYLCLLMPQLEKVKPEAYITSSYADDDILLQEVVLSDNNDRLINVIDVIDTAKEDGILKHNSLFNKQAQALTSTEISRVLSRHVAVSTAMTHITNLVLFKLEGNTAGSSLNRLIQGLKQGGKNGNKSYASALIGNELIAGMDANVAIVAFAHYLESLDAETKQQLMSASKINLIKGRRGYVHREIITLEYYWNILVNPKFQNGESQDTIYCVEMIANKLEEILEANPALYSLVSCQGSAFLNFTQLNEAVALSTAVLKEALSKLQRHTFYAHPTDTFNQTLLSLIKDYRIPLRVEELKFLIQMYESKPDDTVLKAQIDFVFKFNHVITDEYKKLSEEEQSIYKQLHPTSRQNLVAPITFFNKKRKEAPCSEPKDSTPSMHQDDADDGYRQQPSKIHRLD